MSVAATTLLGVPTEPQPASRLLTAARLHFGRAVAARREMLRLWNARSDADSFSLSSRVPSSGVHEVWVHDATPPDTARLLNEAGRQFLSAVKTALDTAVHEAASAVSGGLWPVPPEKHSMPLCLTAQEFEDLMGEGHLGGLRPDQVTELREIQPFQDTGSLEDLAPRLLLHLRYALEQSVVPEEPLIGSWVSFGRLEYQTPLGVTITKQSSVEAGFLRGQRRLGSCLVSPQDRVTQIKFISYSPLDIVFNAAPWPAHPDDNLGFRTEGILLIADAVIGYLSHSTTDVTVDQWLGHLDARLPVVTDSPWLPMQFDDANFELEVHESLAASESNLAMHHDEDGSLILIRLQQGQLLGRQIPQAEAPALTEQGRGVDVENATLAVAAQYALPDFILRPTPLRKGAGVREVGDGTIVAGRLGLAVQVKARGTEPGEDDGERRWLQKKATVALRQARGTIRTMVQQPDLQLKNLRGRSVALRGHEVTWVPVAILDHPAPPSDVSFDDAQTGPGVVLVRRDWDFLWAQLKSTAAVVDYIHRVAPYGSVKLGDETGRYYELADADEQAPPSPVGGVAVALGGTQLHAPKLPQEPAGSRDQVGHHVFSQILEDIATSPFDADEKSRVDVLGMIDRLDVSHREELGRLLLRRLDRCATVPRSALMSLNRTYIVDGGRLHLVFSVYSSLTGDIRSTYQSWLMVRRQDYLQAVSVSGEQLPWTVGVLLTPRVGGERLWDTTIAATNGPAVYLQPEYEELRSFFARIGLDGVPIV